YRISGSITQDRPGTSEARGCGHCRHRRRPLRHAGAWTDLAHPHRALRKRPRAARQRRGKFKLETHRQTGSIEVMTYEVAIDGKQYRLELERHGACWLCRLDGREIQM